MLKHSEMFIFHTILTCVLSHLSDTIKSVTRGNLEIKLITKTYTMINNNKDVQIPSIHNRFIILYYFRATCFDSLESSSGPLTN